uniref:HNH endonuclease n=1 Tax=Pithovirus LCPAC102 TaxID=2506587 RepID=A0A4D5XG15_9VIRU|nr:MAG: HNH endonuclease [Pithovirus LCPAC102]
MNLHTLQNILLIQGEHNTYYNIHSNRINKSVKNIKNKIKNTNLYISCEFRLIGYKEEITKLIRYIEKYIVQLYNYNPESIVHLLHKYTKIEDICNILNITKNINDNIIKYKSWYEFFIVLSSHYIYYTINIFNDKININNILLNIQNSYNISCKLYSSIIKLDIITKPDMIIKSDIITTPDITTKLDITTKPDITTKLDMIIKPDMTTLDMTTLNMTTKSDMITNLYRITTSDIYDYIMHPIKNILSIFNLWSYNNILTIDNSINDVVYIDNNINDVVYIDNSIYYYERIDSIYKSKLYKMTSSNKTKLRLKLWFNTFNNNNIGECFSCCKIIYMDDPAWHCGHIISKYNGGKLELYNLHPICVKCNLDMGTLHMYQYMIYNNKEGINKIINIDNNMIKFNKNKAIYEFINKCLDNLEINKSMPKNVISWWRRQIKTDNTDYLMVIKYFVKFYEQNNIKTLKK